MAARPSIYKYPVVRQTAPQLPALFVLTRPTGTDQNRDDRHNLILRLDDYCCHPANGGVGKVPR